MTAAGAPLHTAHASGLGSVERELASLHRAMLRSGEDGRGVRLSVLTLVVACNSDSVADVAADVVAAIATQHPARALLIVADPRRPPGVEADLSLTCTIASGRDQVCAETVRITVGGDAALHLTSVVTPLLLPDVPVMLWVAGAPSLDQAMGPETRALCERVVVDSGAYAVPAEALLALSAHPTLPVTDLAWSRLRPWRELLARALDAQSRRPFLAGIARVVVDATSPDGEPGAESLLLAGWLASRLRVPGRVELVTRVAQEAGPAGVTLEAADGTRNLAIRVERDGGALRTAVTLDGEQVAGRTVPLDVPTLAELVGAGLQDHGPDPVRAAAAAAATTLV